MVIRIFFLLLLSGSVTAQNADWKELQGMIDAARSSPTGIVTVARNYTIDKPLIIHAWNGEKYGHVSITVQGFATMWDNGSRSVIKATFKDAPILSIQTGKGVIIKGLYFLGGGSDGRDSRYSPYAAICVDPFSGQLPPDGGYPGLKEWYRGPQTRGGSTGLRIEDCSFDKVTTGFISSPNGYTQNAEIITLQNIRSYDVKYVIVGCQAQEKMNRVINLGAWGPSNCVFAFNLYGAQQPGQWIVDGVNIAGSVDSIIRRSSVGWGAMLMKNVFAESIKSIGWWYAGSGDVLSESLINLKEPEVLGYFPEDALRGRYLKIQDVNIRYYGRTETPMLLQWVDTVIGGGFYVPPVVGNYGWDKLYGYSIDVPFEFETKPNLVKNHQGTLTIKPGKPIAPGDHIFFMQNGDWKYMGQGEVEKVEGRKVLLRYISPSIVNMSTYLIGVYRKK